MFAAIMSDELHYTSFGCEIAAQNCKATAFTQGVV
jgi:hypothetical protein